MNISDITITSLETISAFDLQTGNLMFVLDELQNATIAQTQEKTDITGKQGRKLNSLKKNKAVTVSGTNGLVSSGLLGIQVGSDFENNKLTTVKWTEYITVESDGEATISYTAIGSTGSEIDSVWVKDSDGMLAHVLEQGSEAGSGKFTYTPQTKKLTFGTVLEESGEVQEVKKGDEIVVSYERQIRGSVLENMSDNYSGKCALYIDAFAEDKCSNIYRIQFYIPKADFNGEFSFEMGDNQTVHAFEAEALAGACGMSGALWTYTVFDKDASDDSGAILF